MPIPVVRQILKHGVDSVPWANAFLKTALVLSSIWWIKRYFQGTANRSERNMHGKVVLVTGGTSGIGAQVVRELANRGAQIVLLTQHPVTDLFLVEYIEDLRTDTANELITAEQVDLASLHSIRTFATKWIDNAPPRRLDMVVLCGNTLTPKGAEIQSTDDEVEVNWAINYLANFHLLSILSPALRAQPPDRDVRIVVGTCVSYLGGELPDAKTDMGSTVFDSAKAYASSKLALMTFAHAFQKHLSAYARPDKQPNNTRVVLVDPGFCRTPGTRRYLSWGSLTGLALYLILYPFWWLVLKSPDMGAQGFLHAAMEALYGQGEGGWLIKECREVKIARSEVKDEKQQKALWQYSEKMILEAEKKGAKARAEKKAGPGKKEDAAAAKEVPKAQDASTAKEGSKKTTATRRSRKAA